MNQSSKMTYFLNRKQPVNSFGKENLLQDYLLIDNIQRCKLLVKLVIFFQSVLIVFNILLSYTAMLFITSNFYLLMSVISLAISGLMLLYIRHYENQETPTAKQEREICRTLRWFIVFFLIWGVAVALGAQKEYNSLMACAVNFMSVAIFFHASNKNLLQLYSVPVVFLVIGLPFFQSSEAVLLGHYVNLSLFLFFCWLGSRMLYQNSVTSFYNRLLLTETNENLAQIISEKEEINRELKEANIQLKKLATLDELTNLPNRRGLQQYIDKAMQLPASKRTLSFIMLDIDDFKLFNDNYGHFEGDRVLHLVAQQIKSCTVDADCHVSRFGGEEFIITVFDQAPEVVYELADCIVSSMGKLKILHEFSTVVDYVTVSIGVATGEVENEVQIEALKEQADFALYEAKSRGKNRIQVSKGTVEAGTRQ